jgi:dephospho-CoA kinase
MLSIGLTGGIACGKSTVSQMFVRLGGYLIDFDRLAHDVQEPKKPAWRDIVDCFGENILAPDRRIDRIKLGNIVFKHPEKLQKLNEMVHPRVYEAWRLRLDEITAENPRAIVFSDIPLLFEGGMQHLFDLTILVMIEPEEQIRRLMARNHICRDDAARRLACQMPIGEKVALADIVIDNSCAVEETEKKVKRIWRDLVAREKKLEASSHYFEGGGKKR